jgi:methyl-accepting chemotaxis protein
MTFEQAFLAGSFIVFLLFFAFIGDAIRQEIKLLRLAVEKLATFANVDGDHHKEGSLANFAWIFERLTKALNDYIEKQFYGMH